MDNKELEALVKQQADLIKHLKQAITRLEQKLMVVDKRTSRAAEVARRATNDIAAIKGALRNVRRD